LLGSGDAANDDMELPAILLLQAVFAGRTNTL